MEAIYTDHPRDTELIQKLMDKTIENKIKWSMMNDKFSFRKDSFHILLDSTSVKIYNQFNILILEIADEKKGSKLLYDVVYKHCTEIIEKLLDELLKDLNAIENNSNNNLNDKKEIQFKSSLSPSSILETPQQELSKIESTNEKSSHLWTLRYPILIIAIVVITFLCLFLIN